MNNTVTVDAGEVLVELVGMLLDIKAEETDA
jgi:hypothetical protein